jgi:hypothetical protein
MSQVEQTLDQAYQLIENNQLGEAERLLQGLLPQHEANPDVWWLLAHATQDSKRGQEALNKVLSISPDRQDAKDILQRLEPPSKSPARRWLLPALLILALIGGFLLVAVFQPSNPQPEATQVAQQASDVPTELISSTDVTPTPDIPEAQTVDEPTPTPEIVPTVTQTPRPSLSIEMLQQDMPQITFAENAIALKETTTVIGICASPGPEASQAIDILLNYFSRAELDTVGQIFEISINDCVANLEVRALAVDVGVLQAYGIGQITMSELLRQVQPIR